MPPEVVQDKISLSELVQKSLRGAHGGSIRGEDEDNRLASSMSKQLSGNPQVVGIQTSPHCRVVPQKIH